jgi:hypothetical protein
MDASYADLLPISQQDLTRRAYPIVEHFAVTPIVAIKSPLTLHIPALVISPIHDNR